MSLGEHVCEEALKQTRCQRHFLAYEALRLPTGNDSGLYTLAACIVIHVGESRTNVVPSRLAQPIRSWEGPWANFYLLFLAKFCELGGQFWGRKFGPQV